MLDKDTINSRVRSNIRKREKRFQNMNPASKRIAIAKDVIRSVEVEKTIDPQKDRYLLSDAVDRYRGDISKELKDIIINDPTCSACAIGSMFVCTVLRHDQITFSNYLNSEKYENFRPYLRNFFDHNQLNMIESAFECKCRCVNEYFVRNIFDCNDNDCMKSIAFGQKFLDNHSRITAIMRNIVKNKGEFVPA
jgi:hypothetical protein